MKALEDKLKEREEINKEITTMLLAEIERMGRKLLSMHPELLWFKLDRFNIFLVEDEEERNFYYSYFSTHKKSWKLVEEINQLFLDYEDDFDINVKMKFTVDGPVITD